jgi:serine/threonine-protein kinase
VDDQDERRGRGLLILLGVLIVALIAAAAYLLPRMFESPPEQQRVPELIGLTENAARTAIGNAGLAVGDVTYRTDPDVRKDRVLEQNPNPDQYVDPGTEVDLVVSSGVPLVDVPYVIGQLRAQARETLEAEPGNFEVELVSRESDEPRNRVLETDPAPGASVPVGSTVTVYYSDGPEEVPDVVGMQQEEAEAALREAGFEPDVVETTSTTEPKGTVIRQSPEGGEEAPEGSTVTIVVSAYEEPTQTPDPTDDPSDDPSDDPTLPDPTESSTRQQAPPRVSGSARRS